MAKNAHSTRTPTIDRRRLGAGLFATIIGSGITAGAAVSVADLVPTDPDAALLSLRDEMTAAVAGVAYDEDAPDWNDEEITFSSERLSNACWAIIDAPRPQTPAGLALKAAAGMHQFRFNYGPGCWGSDGEEMVWNLLSDLAGDFYVAPILPAQIRANCEPERA